MTCLHRNLRAVSHRGGVTLWIVILVSLLALLLPAVTRGQTYGQEWVSPSWWLRLRTTAYAFETGAPSGAELDRLGGYQHYAGSVSGLANGRLAFTASGRFADDLSLKERVTDRERLYVAYAQYTTTGATIRARLGRQFLQEGPNSLTLDGVWLKTRPARRWSLRAWAGATAPFSRIYEPGDLGDDAAFGVRATTLVTRGLRLGASWAYREGGGVVATRLLGGEATAQPLRGLRAVGRVTYDLEAEEWHRAQALALWNPADHLPVFSAQFVDRRPAIDATSWFSRFSDLERARVGRISARYVGSRGLGAEVEYFGSFLEDRTSTRLGVALLAAFGRLGYSVQLGDAGEENRVFGDVRWAPLSWLQLAGGAVISSYALLEDAPDSEERDLTTAFGRVQAQLHDGIRLSVEIQALDNPLYSEDVRLLAGLDLLAGRGTSTLGLSGGKWLP